jgi:hypothetical protein
MSGVETVAQQLEAKLNLVRSQRDKLKALTDEVYEVAHNSLSSPSTLRYDYPDALCRDYELALEDIESKIETLVEEDYTG